MKKWLENRIIDVLWQAEMPPFGHVFLDDKKVYMSLDTLNDLMFSTEQERKLKWEHIINFCNCFGHRKLPTILNAEGED